MAITLSDGKRSVVVSDELWRAEKREIARWQRVDFDDRDWKRVTVAAPFGGGPWGKIAGLGEPGATDDNFPGIERLPIRPRVATAPVVERP